MKTKRMSFPMEVSSGSATVKIYKVRNRSYRKKDTQGRIRESARFSYYVSYFAGGKRWQKLFADPHEAYDAAKSYADKLSLGQLDALHLSAEDARA